MKHSFFALVKKDFRLMLSARFFLLAAGSLLLYSCYINLVYVNLDDEMFPVYCYDPGHVQSDPSMSAREESTPLLQEHIPVQNKEMSQLQGNPLPPVIYVSTPKELSDACKDGYSVGIDCSGAAPKIRMLSCGLDTIDNLRAAYAVSRLSAVDVVPAVPIGEHTKEMRNRREITAEFLFFELTAVGFLGLAAMLFKEKDMGVIRVHAILPVRKHAFLLSKLGLFLLTDLIFSALLTLINLGLADGAAVLPLVLVQAGILSLLMALVGFFCAIALPDFKQFSLLYLVLAVFITTPVFMAGQMGLEIGWMKLHPMYHLFMAMKNAYFQTPTDSILYYAVNAIAIILLYLLAEWGLQREMKREG